MGACCSNELIKPRESTEQQTPAELNSVFGAAAPLNGIENTNNKGGQKKVATSAARAFLAAVSRRSGTAGPADTVRGRGPATPPPCASVSHSPGNGSFVFTSMNMTATMTHNDGLPSKTNLTSHPSSAPATTTGASAVTATTTTYYYNTNQRKMVPRTRTSQSDLGIVTAAAPVIFPAERPHQRPRGYDSMLGTPVSTATTARLAGLSPGTQSRGITPSSRSPGGRFFSLSPAPQPGMRLNSQFAPFGPDEEDDASPLDPPALPDFHGGGHHHHDGYDHHGDDEDANSTPRSPAGGGGTARGAASGRGQWRADDDTAAVALSMAALAAAMGGGGGNNNSNAGRDVSYTRIAGGVLTSSSTSGGILSAGGGGGGGEHSHDDVLRGSTTSGSSPAAAAVVSPFPYRLYEVARGSGGSQQVSGVSSRHPSAATTPSVSPSRSGRPSNPLTAGGSSESSENASPTRLFARRGTAAFVDAEEVDAVAAAAAAHAASRDGSEGPTATSSTRLDDSSSAGWAARSNGGGSVPLSPSLRSGLRGKSMTPVALSPAEKKSVRFAF